MKRVIVVLLGSLLLAMGLAACGSTNYGSGGASSSPPSGAY
jgi:predicted small secreted protein